MAEKILPSYSRSQVAQAGSVLRNPEPPFDDLVWAYAVLINWRAIHA